MMLAACTSASQVSYQSGGMTQTFTAGKEAGKQDFLLPIYPNATATGEVQAASKEDQNSFRMLTSDDPVNKISEFYLAELKKNGWKVNQQSVLPTLVNISAKKEKLDGSIMISGDEHNKTSINLSVSVEAEGTPEVSKDSFSPDKINPPTD
jgi:hypothetical protein